MSLTSARRRLALLGLAVVACFAAAAVLLPHYPAALARLADLPPGLLTGAVLAAWTLLTPAMVSGTLLAAATGALLGPAVGMPVALAGATLGAAVAFLVSRRLGRGPAEALAGPRAQRLRERIERRPVLGIALVRAAPGSPATLLNHAAGLTSVRLRQFLAGTLLGGAPRVLAYTALGGAAAEHALLPVFAAGGLIALLGAVGVALARRRRAGPLAV